MVLSGRKGLILGVANNRSIAWGIAQALSREGMQLAFSYQGERLESRVRDLTKDLEGSMMIPCDVTKPEEVDALADKLKSEWGTLDTVVHSIAFAPRDALHNPFSDLQIDGFQTAMEISAFSLVQVANKMAPLMSNGGSIITMTYLGSERVIDNYHVMGVAKSALETSMRYLAGELGPKNIRVNAISAGPIRTLASSGIKGFIEILDHIEAKAPLRRNVTTDEVGDVALFLASDASRAMTGEILHVDGGFHIMGMG